VRRFARAIINNGKSYACTYWRIAACWAAPFYASADVVVFSASMLDGKLSSFFGKGLLGLEKVRLTKSSSEFSCLRGENAPVLPCFSPARAEFFRSQVDIRSFELLENAYLAQNVAGDLISGLVEIHDHTKITLYTITEITTCREG